MITISRKNWENFKESMQFLKENRTTHYWYTANNKMCGYGALIFLLKR